MAALRAVDLAAQWVVSMAVLKVYLWVDKKGYQKAELMVGYLVDWKVAWMAFLSVEYWAAEKVHQSVDWKVECLESLKAGMMVFQLVVDLVDK